MLLNAKQILVSELVLAGDKNKEEVEQIVEDKINTSYEMHNAMLENIAQEEISNPKVMKKFIQA